MLQSFVRGGKQRAGVDVYPGAASVFDRLHRLFRAVRFLWGWSEVVHRRRRPGGELVEQPYNSAAHVGELAT